MPAYIALLRAINVTGHNKLAMTDLRRVVEALPADEVRTYLQSGNVVFRSRVKDPAAVARACADAIGAEVGLDVEVLVRTGEQLDRVVAGLPFASDSMVHVTFLAAAPDPEKLAALAAHEAALSPGAEAPDGRDAFHLGEREVYLSCPNGYGRTKLNNALFERKLGVAATTRNWRTVTALAVMARQ